MKYKIMGEKSLPRKMKALALSYSHYEASSVVGVPLGFTVSHSTIKQNSSQQLTNCWKLIFHQLSDINSTSSEAVC